MFWGEMSNLGVLVGRIDGGGDGLGVGDDYDLGLCGCGMLMIFGYGGMWWDSRRLSVCCVNIKKNCGLINE